jgi:UDP-N-acetylmuramoylalanine--D-glutamate ligase
VRFSELAGRRVVVWGHGREGRSVADHLRTIGVPALVAEPDLPAGDEDVQYGTSGAIQYGAAGREALLTADVVVKSPGVPVTSDLYREVLAAGVGMTSLTDLWVNDNAARAVAVTGSKGKSTTSALIDHVLRSHGVRSSLRGNIGTSLLAETEPPAEVVVMEVSSYQAQSLTVSPRVCVVTSLFPEHLTWHGSEEAYFADKLNLVAHGPEVVVVPGDSPDVRRRVAEAVSPGATTVETGPGTVRVDDAGDVVWADGTRVASADLPLRGGHQAANIALAALACAQLGVPPAAAAEAIASFSPLPHRMEPVPSGDGRTWIDDSLATAPEAVVASLASLERGPVALIVGGSDRGLDFAPLVTALAQRDDVHLLLVGPTGRRLHEATGTGRLFDSFADAVAWARSDANPCPTVLLSPGAPSHDEFASYEQRAAAFRAGAI